MRSAVNGRSAGKPRELVALVAASLACVLVVAGGIASGGHLPASVFTSPPVATAALVGGLVLLAGAVIWLTVVRSKRDASRAMAEVGSLKRSLAAADSLIRAEPQILLFWEQNQPLRVVAHTLRGIPGLPETPEKFLRFGQWLEPNSAAVLKPAIDALFKSRPAVQPHRADASPAATSRPRDARPAAAPCCASATSPATATRSLGSTPSTSGSPAKCAPAAPCSMRCRSRCGCAARTAGSPGSTTPTCAPSKRAAAQEVHERQIELLEQRQRRAAARVLARGESYRVRLPLIVGGERKPHDVTVLPFEDATAAAAIDVMALEKTQGEIERQIGALRPHARPRRHRRRDLQCAAAARVLQRGLSQAVAARRRLAEDAADRRRRARPAARAGAPAAGRQLFGVEGEGSRQLRRRHGRGRHLAPAGRAHAARDGREALRRRRHLSVRRRDGAAGARSAITTC